MKTDPILARIPDAYRERVEREMRKAAAAAFGASRLAGDPPWRQTEAHDHDAAAVLARYLKIADEAEGAAARQYAMTRAGGGYTPGDEIPEAMRLVCEGGLNAARAKVWADELAKLDAPAELPPGYWSTGIAVERKADAASDGDTLPPDLAADAVQAVRAAQRAHLDATRAAFTGTVQTEARLDITDTDGLHMVLDGLARYLAEPRDGLPVELTLDVIRLLALSLPRGPLAPAEHQAHTLAALAALVKTIPGNRWPGSSPRLDLATWDAASVARVAALPKAHGFSMPYEQQQMVDVAIANVDGLEVKAQHKRAMTDAERLGLGGGS